MFCNMGICATAFAVFSPYLIREYGLTNTQNAVLGTVKTLVVVFSLLFVTRLYKRIGTRTSSLLAAVTAFVSLVLFAFSGSFFTLCISSGVMGLAYGLGSMMLVSSLIPHWFDSHRALAFGICSSGSGIAVIVVPPVVTSMLTRQTLKQVFLELAVFVLAAGVLVWAVVRSDPSEVGLKPLREPEKSGKYAARRVKLRAEPSPHAALLVVGAYALFAAMAGPGSGDMSVLFSTAGYDSEAVALFLSVYGIALTIGKLVYGQMADRLGTRISSMILFGLVIAGGVLLCFPSSFGCALTGSAVIALGFPLSTVGVPLFAAEISTRGNYLTMLNAIQRTMLVSELVINTLPGIIADRAGSYIPVYALFTVMTAAAAALVMIAFRTPGAKDAEQVQ